MFPWQFFKLDVLYECPDGTLALAPPSHIVKELQAIMDSAPDTCEHPVGILTTEHRDSWYRTRQELLKGMRCVQSNISTASKAIVEPYQFSRLLVSQIRWVAFYADSPPPQKSGKVGVTKK